MEKHCQACKYWDFFDMGFGNCLMAQREEHESLMLARNKEDHGIEELWTRFDFGCNQWDERPGLPLEER